MKIARKASLKETPPSGRIEVRDLAFRYGPGEPFVFENVNFVVEPGDYVAITGPSGGGKTTLLKVLLGLLEPSEGEVLIDGIPLGTFGARALREHAGVVMQEIMNTPENIPQSVMEKAECVIVFPSVL